MIPFKIEIKGIKETMKDYYHYFVNKGNHPNKNNILKQEE